MSKMAAPKLAPLAVIVDRAARSDRQRRFDGLDDDRVLGVDLRAEAGHHLAGGRDQELLEIPRDVPAVPSASGTSVSCS